jgi:hypothetical protein
VSFTGATFQTRGKPVHLNGFAAANFAQRIAWVRSAAAGRSVELNVRVQEVMVAEIEWRLSRRRSQSGSYSGVDWRLRDMDAISAEAAAERQ